MIAIITKYWFYLEIFRIMLHVYVNILHAQDQIGNEIFC